MNIIGFFALTLRSAWRRLRYDLIRELVVLLCSGVLLLTFGLVFNDFVNHEVAQLSGSMRNSFASFLSWIVLVVAALQCGKNLAELRDDPTEAHNAFARLGESPRRLRQWLRARTYLSLIVHFAVAWFLIGYFLWAWSYQTAVIAQAFALLLVAARMYLRTQESANRKARATQTETMWSPLKWRLTQMIRRNRSIQFSLGAALVFAALTPCIAALGLPKPALFLTATAAGLMVSLGLCIQLAEDLQHAWIERACGLSHEAFLSLHKQLSWTLGGTLSLSVGISVSLISIVIAKSPLLDGIISGLQMMGICFAPAFLVPLLGMQIDGKRIFISFTTVVLVGLFLSTAVFAHVLALIIFFLIPSFTEPQQLGRFYRA